MLRAVNGIQVYCEVARRSSFGEGTDKPAVVLLHGGPGMDHMVFKPAFDNLQSHVDVVYYDHRGCGQSEAGPVSGWNLSQWADDALTCLDDLGIRKPIVLGTSFGGLVAQELASNYPDALGGLVLMSTAAKADLPMCVRSMEQVGGKKAAAAAAAFFSSPAKPGVTETFQQQCIGYYAYKGVNWDVLSRVTVRPEVSLHFFAPGGEFHRFDYREALKVIEVPTLVVHGKNDVVFPFPLAEELFHSLENCRKQLVAIPECGHFSEQDASGVIVDAILDFFGLRKA